jgi:transcriptional regulator with XRE-family HTH domain
MKLTGRELRDIRKRLGLSLEGLGRAFGYEGARQSVKSTVHRYETGERPLPAWIARLAIMYDRNGIPDDFFPSTDEKSRSCSDQNSAST